MPNLDLISIVDVKTTGLNPAIDEVIELGCILFSLKHNTVLQQVSTLLPVSLDVSPTEHINGIAAGAANSLNDHESSFLSPAESLLEEMIRTADAVVAHADAVVIHNAPFDKAFAQDYFDRLGEELWIDSRWIMWPRAHRLGCNLVELALCYGVPVWNNHRALYDCQLLAHIIQREPDAKRLLARELEPKVRAIWKTTKKDREGQAL